MRANTGESCDKEVKLSRDVWSGSDNSTGIPGQDINTMTISSAMKNTMKNNDKYEYNDFSTWTQQAGQDILRGGDLAVPDHPVDDCPKCIHCHELNKEHLKIRRLLSPKKQHITDHANLHLFLRFLIGSNQWITLVEFLT